MRYLVCIVFFLFVQQAIGQNTFKEQLTRYQVNALPEKVFVHTDKTIYAGGETIWLTAYLVDGQSHTPGGLSRVIHVQLYDSKQQVVLAEKLYAPEGFSAASLILPNTLEAGNYQLSAYTRYQLNFDHNLIFKKNISIVPGLKSRTKTTPKVARRKFVKKEERKVDIQIFPEGGDCVDGIPCRVAVTANYSNGQPIAMEGVLTDEAGKVIKQISTNEMGVGSFVYIPNKDRYVYISNSAIGIEQELPKPLTLGYHLRVQKTAKSYRLFALTNAATGMAGCKLLVHLRGLLLYELELHGDQPSSKFDIPFDQLNNGVYVATLFDPNNQPVAERLFYASSEEKIGTIELFTDSSYIQPRTLSQLQVLTSNEAKDSLAQAQVSLSIVPESALGNMLSQEDIRTWLLINSDVDFPLPKTLPELISSDEPTKSIDNLLLTRGWRRFVWNDSLTTDAIVPEHEVELGTYLQGQMLDYDYKSKPQPGKVFLTRLETAYRDEQVADEDGYFAFGPYAFFDTVDVLLQGRIFLKKRKDRNLITIDENPYVFMEVMDESMHQINLPAESQPIPDSFDQDYIKLSNQMLTIAKNYDSLSIDLDVVTISASRLSIAEESRNSKTQLYRKPDTRLVLDSMPGGRTTNNFFDLLRRVPGVRVMGNFGQETARIRGFSSVVSSQVPLYLFNGVPIEEAFFQNYDPVDVDFIDILKGPTTAIYGSRGANGVISVYTKEGATGSKNVPGVRSTSIYGFHKSKQFAVFDYDDPENKYRDDIRTTLHWNPSLITDITGAGFDQFLTSDKKGKYIIVAQGLKYDGTPLFGTSSFFIE